MRSKMSRVAARGLALAGLSIAAITSIAGIGHAEVIERVVAVVNDDAIFLSELRQKAAPFLARALQAPTQAQRMEAIRTIYTQLLDRMINERLMSQAADEEDVTITSTEVNEAIANVRQQSGLSEQEFWQAVGQQGFTPAAYRADVRQQLRRLKVLNLRVRSRVNITEEEVRQRYDELAVQARREALFSAAYILFPLPAGGGAAAFSEVMARAQAVRDDIESIDDFEAAQEQLGGREVERVSEQDLAPQLAEALAILEEGQISQPVRTDNAVFLLLLRERDLASADLPRYDEARMQIYQEMMQQAMTRQEELFLEELRRRAVIRRRLDL